MRSLVLGIDCGGTNTKLLLAERVGSRTAALRRTRFPTPGHPDALAEIGENARSFLAGDTPDGFGLAVPGIIDEHGVVLASTNLSWLERLAPAEVLGSLLGVGGPVVNDGAASARAEVILGAAQGERDAFVLALGTGIAGCHVVDGEIRRGAHGSAGEIGHIALGGDRPCSCGQRGCLETEIGGAQLAQRWRELLPPAADRSVSARDVVEAARAGDPVAGGLLDGATTALARSILGLVALVDPGVIVIGGGLAQAREEIVTATIEKVTAMATFHFVPPIVPAALGIWGAACGAVLAATESAARAAPETGPTHVATRGPAGSLDASGSDRRPQTG